MKNQFVPEIITNLNKAITNKLIEHSKSINYFPFSDRIAKISADNRFGQGTEDDCIEEIAINFTPSVITHGKPNTRVTSSPHSPFKKNISVEKK